ncbi:MAG: MMPL family transporter, partial [Thermomicrobiales bacterium]
MTILPSPSSVASNCARHPWRVLGVWLLILVAAGVAASGIGGALTTTSNFSNTPESLKGQQLLKDRLTGDTPVTETVIVTSSTATVDDPAFKDVVEKATSDLLALSGVVESASNVYQVEQSDPATAADLVSADRHTTIVPVTLVGPFNEATDHADEYMQTVEQQGGNGFDVLTVGDVSSAQAFNSVASNDLGSAERIALPVTLIVLVIVFSALVAAGMPIVLALVSIVVAVGLTALVGRLLDLNYLVVNMITMIGMAVGIDYSLFIIQRYREERRRGAEKQLAISRAGGTAGKAVLFSGGTVAIALTGMLLVPLTVFHSLGIGAILVVLVALVAMLTLVPAIISLLGDLIEWPRRHRFDAEAVARQQAEDDEVFHQGFWGHVSHFVMNHAVLSVTTAVLVLVLAALPAINLHRGSAGLETLPDSEVKTAYEILSRDFPVGLLAPVQVVIDGDANDPQVQAATTSLTSALEQDDTFGPATVTRSPANDLTLVSTPLKVDQDSSQATAAVHELRNSIIPHAFDGAPAKVYVTGGPAFNADYFHLIQVATPRV